MSSITGQPSVLWMGSLEPYMDKNFILNAFAQAGEVISGVSMLNNKSMGGAARYCFVRFDNEFSSLLAMHKLNNKIIPNSQPPTKFKLNLTGKQASCKDCSLWIGNLSPDVDDYTLFKGFAYLYSSVRTARVILDSRGCSKGFGFVKFANEDEMKDALFRMDGSREIGTQTLKVRLAYDRSEGQTSGLAEVASANLMCMPANPNLTSARFSEIPTHANLNSMHENPSATYVNLNSIYENPSAKYANQNSMNAHPGTTSATCANPDLMSENQSSPSPSTSSVSTNPKNPNLSSLSATTSSTADKPLVIEIDLVSDSEDELKVEVSPNSKHNKQVTEYRDPLGQNQVASDVPTRSASNTTRCPSREWSRCLVCNEKFLAKTRRPEDEVEAALKLSFFLKNCIGVSPRKCKEVAQDIIQEFKAGGRAAAVSLFCREHQAVVEEATALSENLAKPLEVLETAEETLRSAAGKWITGAEPLEGIRLIIQNALTPTYQKKWEAELKPADGKSSVFQGQSRRRPTADMSMNLRDPDSVMLTNEGSDEWNDYEQYVITGNSVCTRLPTNTDSSSSLPPGSATHATLNESRRESSGGVKIPRSSQYHSAKGGKKKCPVCAQLFCTAMERNNHYRHAHSDGINYRCDTCNRLYSTYGSLQTHLENLHDPVKPFGCMICGIRFGTEVRLRSHVQTHRRCLQYKKKIPSIRKKKKSTTSQRVKGPESRKYRSQQTRASKFQTQTYSNRRNTDSKKKNYVSSSYREADDQLPRRYVNSVPVQAQAQGSSTRGDGSRSKWNNQDGQDNEEEKIVHGCYNCGLDFETRPELDRHKGTCGTFAQL